MGDRIKPESVIGMRQNTHLTDIARQRVVKRLGAGQCGRCGSISKSRMCDRTIVHSKALQEILLELVLRGFT